MRDNRVQAAEIPLAPMIDCVFLLLIYFLLSAALLQPEVDHSVVLPGSGSPTFIPEELIIEFVGGELRVNDSRYGSSDQSHWPELRALLLALSQLSQANDRTIPVIILPEPDTTHDAVTRLIALCHASGLERLTFGTVPSM